MHGDFVTGLGSAEKGNELGGRRGREDREECCANGSEVDLIQGLLITAGDRAV
jgi:hypothetical protein